MISILIELDGITEVLGFWKAVIIRLEEYPAGQYPNEGLSSEHHSLTVNEKYPDPSATVGIVLVTVIALATVPPT